MGGNWLRIVPVLALSALIIGIIPAGCVPSSAPLPASPTPTPTAPPSEPSLTSTPSFTLITSVSPIGDGSVSPSSGDYQQGDKINIRATPSAGYTFTHWSGDTGTIGDPNAASTIIIMNGNYTITANFAQVAHTLTVNSTAGGSVTTPGEGTYTYTYTARTVVNIVATADAGYTFSHWGGDASGTSTTVAVIMDSDKSVTARFKSITYNLSVSVDPSGAGMVELTPPGGNYLPDTEVTLTAASSVGYAFDHWSGDTSEDRNSITITMDSDKTLVAHFTDVTPPMISNVVVTTVTDTKATVKWDTDEPATSQIEHGTTPAYGSTSALDEKLTTSHSLTLIELTPNTTYRFRAKSVDKAGNESLSNGYTFTTKTTKEFLSSLLYSGITIGGRVHQLSFNLFNGSSQTITVSKVEIFDEHGGIAFTMSKSDITETWGSGQVGAGKSLSAGISFGIPPTTAEIEGWQVKWYCLDVKDVEFTVTAEYSR